MLEISLHEFIEAIEQNGLVKTKTGYVLYDDLKNPVAACAFGQAGIHLHINPHTLQREVNRISPRMSGMIVSHNDDTDESMADIAKMVRDNYSPKFLNRTMVFTRHTNV